MRFAGLELDIQKNKKNPYSKFYKHLNIFENAQNFKHEFFNVSHPEYRKFCFSFSRQMV